VDNVATTCICFFILKGIQVRTKTQHEKPTGIHGPFRVGLDQDGTVSGSFMPIAFPKTKGEIEARMVDRFLQSVNNQLTKVGERFLLSEPNQNDENNLDFAVKSPAGEALLELMEIRPSKSPYESAPPRVNVYDFARAIFDGIMEKAKRYGPSRKTERYLLLYVTHWTFILSPTAIACLRSWCARADHGFRAIFLFLPHDETQGEPSWVFPFPPHLLGDFDPETIRHKVCLNLDPRKLEVLTAPAGT
jgi:hypothetical protein